MAYKWIGENWGRSMIYAAVKAGYTIEVSDSRGYDEPVYKGRSAKKAWETCIGYDEVHVFLRKKDERAMWAYLVFDYGQEGDEVISDHSCGRDDKNWIEQWWDAKSAKQWAGADAQ